MTAQTAVSDLLLIEDDPHQREIAAFALSSAGHRVRAAADGREGLAMVAQRPPDLIVCDVNMPGLDGFEVLEILRRDPKTAAIPVVMLTAAADRGQVRRGMSSGADDYLTKPYDPAELVAAVHAVCARHDARHYSTIEQVKERFTQALARQEEVLVSRYEKKLAVELGERWSARLATEGRLDFTGCTVLLADLFSVLQTSGGDAAAAETATILQAARDSLYLFGAVLVLPYGEDVLAVFDGSKDSFTTPASTRAVRSAFALQSAVATALGRPAGQSRLTVALHHGDMTVVVAPDPLHGDAVGAPVPTPALRLAAVLRQFARTRGWAVAASARVARSVPDEVAMVGERAGFAGGDGGGNEAVELRRV